MSDADEAAVSIGDAVIRPAGGPAYVIAEAGVNHNGDLPSALRLVEAAARAGADAVKFQAFRAAALVTADASAAAYQRERSGPATQRELLRALELTAEAFASLQQRCREVGIEFLATPFGPDDLRMLVDLGVRAVKIASPDLANEPLLGAAAATGLPLLLSTGAAEPDEIGRAIDVLASRGARERLILLHCVSSYPTREADAHLRRIRTLAACFGRPTGFSDHTTSVEIGALAVAAGAAVLEKHLTLDRRLPGPDQAFSLEPASFAEYVAGVRRAETALGSGVLGVLDAEREVRRLSRRSVVAAVPIACGERIGAAQLAIKRPGTGIAPADLERVAGRVAAVDIPPDTLIQWEMLR